MLPTLYTLDVEDAVILLYFLDVEPGSLLDCDALLLQHDPLLLTLEEVLEGLELILLPTDMIFEVLVEGYDVHVLDLIILSLLGDRWLIPIIELPLNTQSSISQYWIHREKTCFKL